MIIKVFFKERVMMFGASYKEWEDQVDEYMFRFRKELVGDKPIKVETSRSKWISWGGLKWCNEENFQHQLNREGCQSNDTDNPKARLYSEMKFSVNRKALEKVKELWGEGQHRLKVEELNADEYKKYQKGELEIIIE